MRAAALLVSALAAHALRPGAVRPARATLPRSIAEPQTPSAATPQPPDVESTARDRSGE